MKSFVITLTMICLSLGTIAQLQAVAGIGEHYASFGDKAHCQEMKNDIAAKEKKKNKDKKDIEKLKKIQFNYNTQNCDEKLKRK